jgi:hypothetical protein
MIPLCHEQAGTPGQSFLFLLPSFKGISLYLFYEGNPHNGKSARVCIELWNGLEPNWGKLSRVECYRQEVTHEFFFYLRIRYMGQEHSISKRRSIPFHSFQYAVIVLRDTKCQHCLCFPSPTLCAVVRKQYLRNFYICLVLQPSIWYLGRMMLCGNLSPQSATVGFEYAEGMTESVSMVSQFSKVTCYPQQKVRQLKHSKKEIIRWQSVVVLSEGLALTLQIIIILPYNRLPRRAKASKLAQVYYRADRCIAVEVFASISGC